VSSDTFDASVLDDAELERTLADALGREANRRSRGFPQAVQRSALDEQVGGSHYKSFKIQPLEFSMANGLNACQHTAIKYIVRRKGSRLEDIDKAIHTLRIYRDMIEKGEAE
jgi:hypothetical protein